jgi:hypothetical protein
VRNSTFLVSLYNRLLEFKWKLEPEIRCEILATGQSCEDYMANVPIEKASCPIDVVYTYTVENIGGQCEPITSVVATINFDKTSSISAPDWEFCAEEIVDLRDERINEDLCDMAGDEIDFKLALNEVDGFPGKTSYEYPRPGVTP